MSKPRVGFLGTGWIGRDRMKAMVATGAIDAAALVDPSDECAQQAHQLAPAAARLPSFEGLLDHGLDGLVIATPSAMHAKQAIAALERGIAVFCQKPLGRNAAEVTAVVEAARVADRLLGLDLSYRHLAATQAVEQLVRSGELGPIFAVELTFHNAYGPDKSWFYDRSLSGGGCVIDLGVHLVDLALWLTDFPEVNHIAARAYSGGQPVSAGSREVEDYAVAQIDLAEGRVARLACSWRLHAGQQAQIEAAFYGTQGAAVLRNVGGSFYDFEAVRHRGTARETLVAPPDEWSGRAAAKWALRLAQRPDFDPDALRFPEVAAALDSIYSAAIRQLA